MGRHERFDQHGRDGTAAEDDDDDIIDGDDDDENDNENDDDDNDDDGDRGCVTACHVEKRRERNIETLGNTQACVSR